ncbi:unnamed protein product [Blepharisma stoltei]|uniref:Receptor ligand binding region domain-containing protein n=1 Tax=Blepharisma stoltei TaxID=1481888 RepID=A0AAU9IK05_9CILI|nr:unnamed protein product [Blepharisma stoltei]
MAISILILEVLFSLASSKLSIWILYSQETDWGLINQMSYDLSSTYNSINLFQELIDEKSQIGRNFSSPAIAIDLTQNLLLNQKIKEAARMNHFISIKIDEPTESYEEWEYFSHISTSKYTKSFISVLLFLGWNKIGIIYSDSTDNIRFRSYFEKELTFYGANFFSRIFGNWLSQGVTDELISREIKVKGLNHIIIANEGKGAEKLISSFISKNMYKEGFGLILGSKSAWASNRDGLIFIVEKDLEYAKNLNNYHSLSIINFLRDIDFESESIYAVKALFQKSTINHQPLNLFSIVNVQGSSKKIVGYIENNIVNISDTIIYPGNTTIAPSSQKPPIIISVASGDSNFNGLKLGSNSHLKLGSSFALKYAEYIHILENFSLKLYPTDCSADFYYRPFSYNCLLSHKDSLGVAFLPSYNDNVCYGTIKDFRDLGIKIPLISDECTSELFTNKTAYPEFVRIMKSFAFHSNMLAYLMSIFSWKCAVVFYENSTFGLDMYKNFYNVAKTLGIKIVNDEDKRMLNPLYSPQLYGNYSNYMKNAIATQCKIVVPLLEPTPMFNLFGQLYDEGIRRNDMIFLLYLPIAGYFENSQAITADTKTKVKELLFGSLVLWQSEWLGSYGASLIALGNKFYGFYLYYGTCPSFDAMMLGIHGIKYLIDAGGDYEDPELLNEGIRKVKFIGCSGTVQISSNSNEKSTAIISIMNEIYNETLGYYVNYPVGTYSIGSNPPFSFTRNIIWPDNTTNVPGEKRLNPDNCPFNLRLIRDSDAGSGLYYGLVFGITIIVVFLSAVILVKIYWKSQIFMITERCEVKANDYLAMSMIFIDFLQYLAMGPDIY